GRPGRVHARRPHRRRVRRGRPDRAGRGPPMTGARLALRLARREVWRRPGRTALAALLVALPVAAMASAQVLIRTERGVTETEKWQRENGDADAVSWSAAPIEPERALPEVTGLPDGARRLIVTEWWQRARATDGSRSSVTFTD